MREKIFRLSQKINTKNKCARNAYSCMEENVFSAFPALGIL